MWRCGTVFLRYATPNAVRENQASKTVGWLLRLVAVVWFSLYQLVKLVYTHTARSFFSQVPVKKA
jgi:hypothetical protein